MRPEIRWDELGWAVWFTGIYFIPTPAGQRWVDIFLLLAVAFSLGMFAWSVYRNRRHPTVTSTQEKK